MDTGRAPSPRSSLYGRRGTPQIPAVSARACDLMCLREPANSRLLKSTARAGPAVIVSIIIAGAICFLTATTYAQLGGLLQEAGGGYLWVRLAFSRRAGFTAGWISWFGHSIACSFYIVIFAGGILFLVESVAPGSQWPIPTDL